MKPELLKLTDSLSPEIIQFSRELVRIPSFTGQEGNLAKAVMRKMKALDYDHVSVDALGNVIGIVGDGPLGILFDSHMDTVGVNHPEAWQFNPFGGEIVEGKLYGRGSVDMKSALAAAVYAGHITKRLGLQKGKTIYITASVMEEDFDGETVYTMCRQLPRLPDYGVICEPSGLDLALGHKGRALIKVTSAGVSAHGGAPDKGVNAVYKMGPLLQRVETLNKTMVGKGEDAGSIAITKIDSTSESLNAIPDKCDVFLDRRLVKGEDQAAIVEEMDTLLKGMDASWEIFDVHGESYTGMPVVLHSFLPAWEIGSDSVLARAGVKSYETLFNREPQFFKWNFSTNGVATAGRLNIPTIGFGPGDSKLAHTLDEYCEVAQIIDAAGFYSLLPAYLFE